MKKIDASLYNTPIRFYNYAKLMFSENSDGVYVTFKTLRELNSIIGYINKERDKQLDIEEGFVSDKYSVIWKRKLFSLTCGEIKTIKYDSYPIDICFGSIEQLHKFAEEFTKSPMSQETVQLDKSKGKDFSIPKDKNTKNALSKETQKFQLKVFFVGLSVCLVGLFVYMLFDNSGSGGATSTYGLEDRTRFSPVGVYQVDLTIGQTGDVTTIIIKSDNSVTFEQLGDVSYYSWSENYDGKSIDIELSDYHGHRTGTYVMDFSSGYVYENSEAYKAKKPNRRYRFTKIR